ncbi:MULTISPECIES: DNA polymerase III subunit beta [Pseudovibrio]|uniref:DNA polymerase III subunit beta n=1 Tax=Stappiaceae TaxID=2821832 RepID=UPI00236558EC|nr:MULTISPECIES: DNA polymerase III subunit beta [Pseudovibrio]MDD7909603.1 DNA polymerase III subunit beta [Pseudovibrio exalbescens]MDX5595044.1 DNA polymerase III subunit beta [Pseudovibrio sp. SPO723]
MKATLERTELLKSLTHVHRVVERRNTIPILSNVMLQTEGGELKLRATDLDLEVLETIPAVIEVPGATTVPAHMIYEIVRKLPDGSQVVLETSGDDTTLEIRAGRSRFALQMLPISDFPDMTAGDFTHAFTITAGGIRKLIDATQFAISTEETRYYLNGIYMHAVETEGEQRFRAVATDGHRLAQSELPAPEGSEGMPGIIVPRKTVGEIQKLLEDPEAEVRVEISETKIRFTTGPVVLTSKLIDGSFPDYGRVIPKNNDKEMRVDRDVFKEAVDRVSTISSERGRAVKLALTEGKLVLTVTNPDSGSATEELMVEYDSDDMEIGFNSKYLLDIAGQLSADAALFRLADSGSPTLIQEDGKEDTLFVLMPMRV